MMKLKTKTNKQNFRMDITSGSIVELEKQTIENIRLGKKENISNLISARVLPKGLTQKYPQLTRSKNKCKKKI